MPNSYAQAALTYYRRFLSLERWWVVMGITSLWILLTMVFVLKPIPFAAAVLMFIGLFQSIAIVIHLKDQFVDVRAQLIPNYRRVHFVVAILVVLLSTVLLPAVLSWLAGLRSFGLAACFSIIFAASFLAILGRKQSFQAVFMLLILGTLMWAFVLETGRGFGEEFISGKREPEAYVLTAFALGIILLCLWRLIHITEDDAEYPQLQRIAFNESWAAVRAGAYGPVSTHKWAVRLSDLHIARISRHAQRTVISGWSRICRWQVGINISLFLGVCSAGVASSLVYFLLSGNNIVMPAIFSSILPLFIVGRTYFSHRLSFEMMLPVDRRSYIRQMGLSMAIGLMCAWAVSWSSMVFVMTQIMQVPIGGKALVNITCISALFQVLYYGVAVWIGPRQSKYLLGSAIVVPYILHVVFTAITLDIKEGALGSMMVPMSGIAAVIGLLFTFHAYRRWLKADID